MLVIIYYYKIDVLITITTLMELVTVQCVHTYVDDVRLIAQIVYHAMLERIEIYLVKIVDV